MTYTPLPHPSSGWVGLCGAGLHIFTRSKAGPRTRVGWGPGAWVPNGVHVYLQRSEWTQPSVGDLVRGPRRGCMSLGQSGPGQGSVGDSCSTVTDEGA